MCALGEHANSTQKGPGDIPPESDSPKEYISPSVSSALGGNRTQARSGANHSATVRLTVKTLQ